MSTRTPESEPRPTPGADYPTGALMRRARQVHSLSQAELARRSGVSRTMLARIESGSRTPNLATMTRILRAIGLEFAVVDSHGHRIQPMLDRADLTDGAGRRYPAHLDVVPDPVGGEWWASIYCPYDDTPPETFRRR